MRRLSKKGARVAVQGKANQIAHLAEHSTVGVRCSCRPLQLESMMSLLCVGHIVTESMMSLLCIGHIVTVGAAILVTFSLGALLAHCLRLQRLAFCVVGVRK